MKREPTFKKLILADLNSRGLAMIASKITSITYESFSMGNAVNVKSVNLSKGQRETLQGVLRSYQHGSFDGMTDMYEYEKTTTPRSAKYVSLSNSFTPEAYEKVVNELKDKYDIVDDSTAQNKMGCWYDQAVHRLLSEKELEFFS